MNHCYFITGTDTEVGKTFSAAALLARAGQRGWRTAAFKPVAAGADETASGLRNEDALTLISACTQDIPYERVNPFCLRSPVAPHIAAAEEGVQLDVSALVDKFQAVLNYSADFVLVEGAGGWRVPLNQAETMADFAIALKMPVILVVAMRLGCINHALLTAEAIGLDGLRLAGWVANQVSRQPMARPRENLLALQSRLNAPLLGEIPFTPGANFHAAAKLVKLPDQLEQ